MSLKILIVDDISENITSLIDAISQTDIQFVAAHSGKDALRFLAKYEDFDLALIDVQMPEMDGYELAQLMRGVEKTRQIPIIFITAQTPSLYYSEFKGANLGAIDFIFKPVNIKMLKSKIDVFQNLKTKRLILDEKIEELKRAKKKLEISEKKAIEADSIKSTFLANMSHEVRTPITALIGFAELLKPLVKNNKTAEDYTDIILRNGKHLLDLVNDILDISKVEAGQLDLDPKPIQLGMAIDEVINLLLPLAKLNNVKISFDPQSFLQAMGHANPLRLKQVITNVIGNSIKFSPQGQVSIYLEPVGTTEHFIKWNIYIKDSGIGIDSAKLDQLFKPFSQLREISNHAQISQGTGLGLSLSKKLMQKMNGDLILKESALNNGSTFVISVPAAIPSRDSSQNQYFKETLQRSSTLPLKDLNILLADDSADNRILIEAYLKQFGAEIISVENGEEAVTRVQISTPDIILMDYKMPIMNGILATKKLRNLGYATPIILLTANAMRGEREIALQSGASGYISKPIDWNELIREIQFYLNNKSLS